MPKPRDNEAADQRAVPNGDRAGSNPAPAQEPERDEGLSRIPFATAAEAARRVERVRGALAKLWDKNHAASSPDPAPADSPGPEPSEEEDGTGL